MTQITKIIAKPKLIPFADFIVRNHLEGGKKHISEKQFDENLSEWLLEPISEEWLSYVLDEKNRVRDEQKLELALRKLATDKLPDGAVNFWSLSPPYLF